MFASGWVWCTTDISSESGSDWGWNMYCWISPTFPLTLTLAVLMNAALQAVNLAVASHSQTYLHTLHRLRILQWGRKRRCAFMRENHVKQSSNHGRVFLQTCQEGDFNLDLRINKGLMAIYCTWESRTDQSNTVHVSSSFSVLHYFIEICSDWQRQIFRFKICVWR